MTLEQFRAIAEGIGRGQLHCDESLRVLPLFTVDPDVIDLLRIEAEALVASEPGSDVGNAKHVTNWTRPFGSARQFSLKNRSGRLNDFSSDHDGRSVGKRFHRSERFPMLGELVDAFPQAINVRLNVLGPNSGLSPHEEPAVHRSARGWHYRTRFHIPLTTNEQAIVLLDGHEYHLTRGVVWFFNNGCVHAAANRHPVDRRLHIVFDQWLTADTLGMFQAVPPVAWMTPVVDAPVEPVAVVDVERFEVQRERQWTSAEWMAGPHLLGAP